MAFNPFQSYAAFHLWYISAISIFAKNDILFLFRSKILRENVDISLHIAIKQYVFGDLVLWSCLIGQDF